MGASASLIPMQVDKDTFRRLSGGTFNDSLFDAHAVGGIITRDKLIELSKTTDAFLSHDVEIDSYGRNTFDRVRRMYNGLKAKGLSLWFVEDQLSGLTGDVAAMCNGIDKARCIIVFITEKYVEKVQFGNITDNCQQEFNYALRRKTSNQIIPVIMESHMKNPREWPGSIGTALSNSYIIDFTEDERFDTACDDLLQRIVKVMRSISTHSVGGSEFTQNKPHVMSGNREFDAAAREETQFSQWMARSTKINESRRIVYCAALVKLGVTSVQKLAKKMKEVQNFLQSIGVLEYDADEIALAISDLGLGYQPVREFIGATSIESATYALKKSSSAPEDHLLASNALKCVGQVAEASPENPFKLCQLGFGDAIVKVMINHLGDASCVKSACEALHVIAAASIELNEYFSTCSPSPCVMIPKAMQSHMKDAEVVEAACKIIAVLALNNNNRIKLGVSGVCDILMKCLSLHVANVRVCERGMYCMTNLSSHHYENIGKLGSAGAVDIVSASLHNHSSSAIVAEQSFRTIVLLAQDPDIRTNWGKTAPAAIVDAFRQHINVASVVEQACYAIHSILVGSTHNRTILGQSGACEVVKAGVELHHMVPGVAYHGSMAIYSLASGCPINQQRLDGIGKVLQHILLRTNMSDQIKHEVKEASLRVR